MKNKGILIVISGPTGAGKSEIISALVEKKKDLYLSISDTTRAKKSKDIEGKKYNFISRQEFFKKVDQGAYLEWAEVYQDYFGTPKHIINKKLAEGKDVILAIDIKGALQIKEKYEEAVFIFILPPSVKVLKERIMDNKVESTEALTRKFNSAYAEIQSISKYNYGVISNNIEEAVNRIEHIILAEKCRVDRTRDSIDILKSL